MASTLEYLKNAIKHEKAFTSSPKELSELYSTSRTFLTRTQGSMDDNTWFNLLSQHFYLALFTSHDNDANLMLARITDRFGEKTGRVALLKSQYLEATEGSTSAVEYLKKRPENELLTMKRKSAFAKFDGNLREYIQELLALANIIPTDVEIYLELAEAYVQVGQYELAVHALQDAIVIYPHAYPTFARIGEIYHTELARDPPSHVADKVETYSLALKHFLRAVELCPVFVRGWAGVLVISKEILDAKDLTGKLATVEKEKYIKLKELAESRLVYIVSEKLGTSEQLSAAKAILDEY